jgi:hypothetical protein
MQATTPLARLGAGCLILLALAGFLLAGLNKLHERREFSPYDTSAYMTGARIARQNGGPFRMLADCYAGRWTLANPMPVCIALLSVLPVDRLEGLGWAKLLMLGIAAAGIVVCALAGRGLFETAAGVLAAALLACNTAWLTQGTMVCCEPLFAVWILLAWAYMARYARTGRGGIWIGLFIGLACMTKANGLFLLPAALGAFAWRERRRLWRSREAWAALLALAVVTSPEVVRNLRLYGGPVAPSYSLNRGFMWLNSPEEMFAAEVPTNAPTAGAFWRTHTLGQILRRAGAGLVQQGIYSVVAVGQMYPLNERLRLKAWPLGLLLLLLALAPFCSPSARPAAVLGWGIFLIFFLFFAWYPARDIRFIFPLVPILLILAARGLLEAHRRIGNALGRPGITGLRPALAAALLLSCATIALAAPWPGLRQNPRAGYRLPSGYEALREWLHAHASQSAPVMLGPSHEYAYFWDAGLDGCTVPVPWTTAEALPEAMRAAAARYAVLDYSLLRDRPGLRALAEAADDSVRLPQKLPPPWRIAFRDPADPPAFVVLSAK